MTDGGSEVTSDAGGETGGTTIAESTAGESSTGESTSEGEPEPIDCEEYLADFDSEHHLIDSIAAINHTSRPLIYINGLSFPGIQEIETGRLSRYSYLNPRLCANYGEPLAPSDFIPKYGTLILPGAEYAEWGDPMISWGSGFHEEVEMPLVCVEPSAQPDEVVECTLRHNAVLGRDYRAFSYVSDDLTICDPSPCACPGPNWVYCEVELHPEAFESLADFDAKAHIGVSEPFEFVGLAEMPPVLFEELSAEL